MSDIDPTLAYTALLEMWPDAPEGTSARLADAMSKADPPDRWEFSRKWIDERKIHYARVVARRGEDEVAPYMPGNYRVIGHRPSPEFEGYTEVIIAGINSAGWTMDDYVLPRLGSGMLAGKEIPRTEASEVLGGPDSDRAWEDAYGIAWIGASNPQGVQRTWLIDAARNGEDHPGVRAIKGHLDFLHGFGLGPEGLLDQVLANARRLGIEDDAGNYVPKGERRPQLQHEHRGRCATVGCKNDPAEMISYHWRGEDEETKELVCHSCADSYARRPVLAGFQRSLTGTCPGCGCEPASV